MRDKKAPASWGAIMAWCDCYIAAARLSIVYTTYTSVATSIGGKATFWPGGWGGGGFRCSVGQLLALGSKWRLQITPWCPKRLERNALLGQKTLGRDLKLTALGYSFWIKLYCFFPPPPAGRACFPLFQPQPPPFYLFLPGLGVSEGVLCHGPRILSWAVPASYIEYRSRVCFMCRISDLHPSCIHRIIT